MALVGACIGVGLGCDGGDIEPSERTTSDCMVPPGNLAAGFLAVGKGRLGEATYRFSTRTRHPIDHIFALHQHQIAALFCQRNRFLIKQTDIAFRRRDGVFDPQELGSGIGFEPALNGEPIALGGVSKGSRELRQATTRLGNGLFQLRLGPA